MLNSTGVKISNLCDHDSRYLNVTERQTDDLP